jgi:hypothetical protein
MTDQPNPTAGREDVFAALHRWLDEREAKGLATYGKPLMTFNGRDVQRDLREELLDALVYEQKRQMERAALVELLQRARDIIWGVDWTQDPRPVEWVEDADATLGPDPEAWR